MNPQDPLITGPYCGLPPPPAELLSSWNTDWRLLLGMALLAGLGFLMRRRGLFALGWVALGLAFVSPLCAFTVALFSARAAHHLWLVTVAAPLLGAALPCRLRAGVSKWALLVLLHVLALWHVPAVYALAWHSHGWFWGLQLLLLASAVLFWSSIFAALSPATRACEGWHPAGVWGALIQIAALAGVMGLIAAVLTFAPRVLYPEHGLAPLYYGLTPLEDQQLGALVMWVPGFLPLLALAAVLLWRGWQQASAPAEVLTP